MHCNRRQCTAPCNAIEDNVKQNKKNAQLLHCWSMTMQRITERKCMCSSPSMHRETKVQPRQKRKCNFFLTKPIIMGSSLEGTASKANCNSNSQFKIYFNFRVQIYKKWENQPKTHSSVNTWRARIRWQMTAWDSRVLGTPLVEQGSNPRRPPMLTN
jgi:hypothetical protein